MLALIVGQGDLPGAVARAQANPPLVCALEGFAPEALAVDLTFRLETLGSLLATLKARGVTEVCLCGRIRRPDVDLSHLDDLTRPLVPRLSEALQLGDDGALRIVMTIFEAEDFAILAAHEAAPELLMASGVPTLCQPAVETGEDAARGDEVLAAMGRADLGQACVIVAGAVVAREGEAGTDAMLGALIRHADPAAEPRGILFKAPKPGQDRRADLATIGVDTVRAVAKAGLAGIVIEAGGVIVLERARVVAEMDRAGLFLWVRD